MEELLKLVEEVLVIKERLVFGNGIGNDYDLVQFFEVNGFGSVDEKLEIDFLYDISREYKV